MSLTIVRWLFVTVAGISALAVTFTGWMALSFGGPAKGFAGGSSIILPMLCLPLFVLFLFRSKWGFYLSVLYLLAGWGLQILISAPRILINPLSSGMDKIILLCVCSMGISYAAQKRKD
jgi:hypothetical protein